MSRQPLWKPVPQHMLLKSFIQEPSFILGEEIRRTHTQLSLKLQASRSP